MTIHALGLAVAFRWMKRESAAISGRLWPATWMLIRVAGFFSPSSAKSWASDPTPKTAESIDENPAQRNPTKPASWAAGLCARGIHRREGAPEAHAALRVVMMLIAALTAAPVTNSGRSAWFVCVRLLMVDAVFAMTLYLLPPRGL